MPDPLRQPPRQIKPVLLVAGLVVAALAIRSALAPGIWLIHSTPSIDADIDAREKRLRSIQGSIADSQVSEGYEQHTGSMLYLSTSIVYEATPPGATQPVRTDRDVRGKYPISRHGEVPANLPRRGDPHALWYDPNDPTYLTFYPPHPVPSIGTFAWILLGAGATGAVVGVVMVYFALRRPRRSLAVVTVLSSVIS